MAGVDKGSGSYVAHQVDRCRAKLAELTASLQMKREYQKRLQAKLEAYKATHAQV